MKKLIAISALLAISGAASAQLVAKGTYDLDFKNGSGRQSELGLGFGVGTRLGTFDAAFVTNRYNLGGIDNTNGFEVGYGASLPKLGPVAVTGRVGYGRKNQIDGSGSGFSGNVPYYNLGVEGSVPWTPRTNVFAGYKFESSTNGQSYTQSRISTGIDYRLTQKVTARVGYAFTMERGQNYNGITTAISYKF
jgi:opacity protein-like surface antigen